MPDVTVARRGTDSSGRGIFATDYMWAWWQLVLAGLPFGHLVVITQGAFMTLAGGGAAGSAGYHDEGGTFDLRVWNLSEDQVGQLVRSLRAMGAAAWLRNLEHGGFEDPHIHFVLGTDRPLSEGAAFQWSEYLAGRDGLAGRGADYHWRPDPLVTTPPKEEEIMATMEELEKLLDRKLSPVLKKITRQNEVDRARYQRLLAELDEIDKDQAADTATIKSRVRTIRRELAQLEAAQDGDQ